MVCHVIIDVPNEVMYDTHMNKSEATAMARRMLALGLYTQNNVSIGYCAKVADMTEEEFSNLNMINKNATLKEEKEYKIYKTNIYSFKLEHLEENGKYIYCTIVEGSTLWAIAQKNETTIEEILEINPNIKDPNNIPIGETIKIPRNKEKTLKK